MASAVRSSSRSIDADESPQAVRYIGLFLHHKAMEQTRDPVYMKRRISVSELRLAKDQ